MLAKSLFLLVVVSFFPLAALAAEVRLSVAMSMLDATKELIVRYQQRVEGIEILPNFASSGALAKQIAEGAPADIFISANPKWMNFLLEQKLIPENQVRTLAYNRLVIVGDKDVQMETLADVIKLSKIAMGSPKSTPVGQYAEQALVTAGLYDQLAGKLVLTKDVRQAILYADQGEVAGAFVYKTDALMAARAVILLEVPPELHDEVTYTGALTSAGVEKPEAVAFYAFLQSPEAVTIMQKFGFMVY